MNLKTTIQNIIKNSSLPYEVKVFQNELKETAVLEQCTDHFILIVRPITYTATYTTGQRNYIYNNLNLIFGKLSIYLANSDTDGLNTQILQEAQKNYETIIKGLRSLDLVKVTSEQITEIFNDKDMNITGLQAVITIDEIITYSQC